MNVHKELFVKMIQFLFWVNGKRHFVPLIESRRSFKELIELSRSKRAEIYSFD